MIRLTTEDYKFEDKVQIVTKFMLPKLMSMYSFEGMDVVLDDAVIRHIIRCSGDAPGMRSIKRNIEALLGNLNLKKLIGDVIDGVQVTFPCTVTPKLADAYMFKVPDMFKGVGHMYM